MHFFATESEIWAQEIFKEVIWLWIHLCQLTITFGWVQQPKVMTGNGQLIHNYNNYHNDFLRNPYFNRNSSPQNLYIQWLWLYLKTMIDQWFVFVECSQTSVQPDAIPFFSIRWLSNLAQKFQNRPILQFQFDFLGEILRFRAFLPCII